MTARDDPSYDCHMDSRSIITLNEMESLLEDIVNGFPGIFFKDLNGGILLLPDVKLNKNALKDDLYILGEYHHDSRLGRYITIYYGSFIRVFGFMPKHKYKDELQKTIKHEFVHHLESLAGDNSLAIKDNEYIKEYLKRNS